MQRKGALQKKEREGQWAIVTGATSITIRTKS